MNSTSSPLALLAVALVAGGIGFGAGIWVSRPHDAGATGAAGSATTTGDEGPPVPHFPDAATGVKSYAEAVIRLTGTFRDVVEFSRAQDKLNATKAGLLAFGPKAFDDVIAFVGPPPSTVLNSDGPAQVRDRKPQNDPQVREAMLRVLVELDKERAGPELAKRLLSPDEHGRVRSSAAGMLGHVDRAVAVPALVSALESASQRPWDGARDIVDGMQLHGGREIEECLMKVLVRPTTELGLRIRVCEAIGTLKIAASVPELETVIKHEDSNHYLRRCAVRSLLAIDPAKADAAAIAQYPMERDEGFTVWLEDYFKSRSLTKPERLK